MTSQTTDKTAIELAQLRAELHATNANIERIATALERTLSDHETRLRTVEGDRLRAQGVIRLVAWLGAPTVAAVLFLLAKSAGH
ncbi:hypothetical protein RugamoR57_37350 [Duganella caerulea]|uniref:hypothetical protein n=1 Tax=Duganella caerulea TaxID=2885762 RepID=UPI0030E79426